MRRRSRWYHPNDPDAPEPDRCPECDAVVTVEGDKFEWDVHCENCGYTNGGGIDPQDYLEQQAELRRPERGEW